MAELQGGQTNRFEKAGLHKTVHDLTAAVKADREPTYGGSAQADNATDIETPLYSTLAPEIKHDTADASLAGEISIRETSARPAVGALAAAIRRGKTLREGGGASAPPPIAAVWKAPHRPNRLVTTYFASACVADIKVPKLTYEFPPAFPESARAKVLAERLRAEEALARKRGSIREFADAEALLLEFILRVFVALAREGHQLGIQGTVKVDELESECLGILRNYAIEADLMDNGLRMPNADDVEIRDDIRRNIENSEEWKTYRRLLIEVADAQAIDEPSSFPKSRTRSKGSAGARVAKEARAATVARIVKELNLLRPQMFEDESEYHRLRNLYPDFLTFKIADERPDLKTKVLAIQGSTRHIRLAQELAGAHHERALATIRDDWKDFKPAEFKRAH